MYKISILYLPTFSKAKNYNNIYHVGTFNMVFKVEGLKPFTEVVKFR